MKAIPDIKNKKLGENIQDVNEEIQMRHIPDCFSVIHLPWQF